MTLPKLFEDRMRQLLGEEYEDYEKCFDNPHYGGLRVNTMKISPEEFEKICPFPIERIPWVKNGYFYDINEHPARHPFYYGGLYYIQEPSAMTPASLLPIESGDKVLDICAAPGGKSTELGARLNGTGILVSNDISNSRAKALLKNIELFGIRNSVVTSETPDKLQTYFPEYFDKILIDAPCSGEGMFRKNVSMVKNWEEYGVEYYSEIQKDIICTAARMLKPGGYILYSTCTFSPEENEGTIGHLLEQYPEFTVVSPYMSEEIQMAQGLSYEGFDCGKPEWIPNGVEEMKHCIRLWPHKLKGEGHFIALLHKRTLEQNGIVSEVSNYDHQLQEFSGREEDVCAASLETDYFGDLKGRKDNHNSDMKGSKYNHNSDSKDNRYKSDIKGSKDNRYKSDIKCCIDNRSNRDNKGYKENKYNNESKYITKVKSNKYNKNSKGNRNEFDLNTYYGNNDTDLKGISPQSKLSDEAIEFIQSLQIDGMKDNFISLEDIVVRDNKVYHMPKELPDLKGLRILRHGLLLGEMKKERFEPSQALANALYTDGYGKILSLTHDNSNIIRFLKCESIELEGSYEDGWNLICVDNHPLGWCKITKQNFKNKYAPGWRWV